MLEELEHLVERLRGADRRRAASDSRRRECVNLWRWHTRYYGMDVVVSRYGVGTLLTGRSTDRGLYPAAEARQIMVALPEVGAVDRFAHGGRGDGSRRYSPEVRGWL